MELIPDNIDFSAYLDEPEHNNVRPASDWMGELIETLYSTNETKQAPGPLFQKTRGKLAFRPAEVTVWAGVNGHGKSMFLSQTALDLCFQNERVMISSFEMRPVKQMERMTRQAYGGRYPTREFIDKFGIWTDGRLWIHDHLGSVESRKLLGVMRYAVKEFGITHFVIDSLMKCVRGEDDYNSQKDFLNELCAFVQANNVHVHLVHHVRKGESELKPPGKYDLKGSGAIADQVDNLLIVWRDKKAEAERKGNPTCILSCEKQRHGEFEGKFGFWFDIESQQYLETPSEVATRYELK